jgi:hypothetical protein
MDQRKYEKERACDAKVSHTKSNCSLVALSYWHPRASVVVVVMMIIAQTLC